METNYPTLRRPKRKLCYLANKESLSKQWAGTLTLGDVDKMFDDLDSCSQVDLLHSSESDTNHSELQASPAPQGAWLTKETSPGQMGPKGDVLLPTTPPSPNVDPDLNILFDVNGPIKTSSPIERNVVVEGVEEEGNEKKQINPPILMDCEDDVKDDTKTQDAQSKELVTEGNHDCELESPSAKITFSKSTRPSHRNKVEGSCKVSCPVKEKTCDKPQTPVVEGKRKPARQENSTPPAKQANGPAPPEKHKGTVHSQSPAEMSSLVRKDKTPFLQILRLNTIGQPKPVKKLSQVKVPSPPSEPEDDFLILEDDTPLWFSIPSKTATSKRGQQTRAASTDKNSSTDKGTEDRPLETVQKEDNQKMKKMKGKKKNELTGPGNDEGDMVSPEDLPVSDEVEPAKPNKKKQQLLKTPSKESDRVKEAPDEENFSQKVKKKAQKFSETKNLNYSKDRKETAKTGRAKSLKGTKKVMQKPEDTKEQNNERDSDIRDFGCLTDSGGVEDLAGGKAKGNKLPGVSEGSSSEEGQTLGKRKRKQTGQWWLSSQRKEETETTNNHPTVEKSKQHSKEPRAAGLSPVKAKEDGRQSAIQAKEKKRKQNKNRPARGGTREKRKATCEVFNTNEAEERDEQQQEAPNQDMDPEQSSPLVFSHSDISRTSGDQIFPRVYHNVSNEKLSNTPRHPSPKRPVEQLTATEPGKRMRRPPGNWWKVNGVSEDMKSTCSQSQQLDPMESKLYKHRRTQSKQSRPPRLGSPKHGNMLVSSKTLGGAHISPLNVKTLSAQKTAKCSLAQRKEKFTSAAETPTVVSSRDTSQNNIHDVNWPLAEEVTVTDCVSLSKTDRETLSMGAGEYRNSQNGSVNHDNPQYKPENTLNDLRSGPSSMIELDQYEENDMILPSPRVTTTLSVSDLCAPPLRPLTLQPKDKANLTEWLKSLWSPTVNNGSDITPDQFDWYFYQGRAIGILADLSCGSICNGKILLGSYTKKPLWVDHSATTVFNILTSSVSVTIDGTKSVLNSGQSFMVECGHAYSIQNVTALPAVLCFTRIYAESSD